MGENKGTLWRPQLPAWSSRDLHPRRKAALLVQKKSLPRQIGIDRDTKTVDVAATCFICVSARLLMAST